MRRTRGGRDHLAAARRCCEGEQAGEQHEKGTGPTHQGLTLARKTPNYPVRFPLNSNSAARQPGRSPYSVRNTAASDVRAKARTVAASAMAKTAATTTAPTTT